MSSALGAKKDFLFDLLYKDILLSELFCDFYFKQRNCITGEMVTNNFFKYTFSGHLFLRNLESFSESMNFQNSVKTYFGFFSHFLDRFLYLSRNNYQSVFKLPTLPIKDFFLDRFHLFRLDRLSDFLLDKISYKQGRDEGEFSRLREERELYMRFIYRDLPDNYES